MTGRAVTELVAGRAPRSQRWPGARRVIHEARKRVTRPAPNKKGSTPMTGRHIITTPRTLRRRGRTPSDPQSSSRWGTGRYVSPKVKDQVRRRDKVCQLDYPGCGQRIEEFHHPEGLADQGKQRTSVLSAAEVVGVCRHCHAIDTQQRQQHGRDRARAARGSLSRRYREHEPHPGHIAAGQEGVQGDPPAAPRTGEP